MQKQVEYYFSVENLCKDIFLRSQVRLVHCTVYRSLVVHRRR